MAPSASSFGIFPMRDDGTNPLLWKIAAASIVGLGLAGTDWVTDTGVHTGRYWAFHALTDCVLGNVTYEPGQSTGSPAGLKMLGGDRIYGRITSLQLVSGAGELYRQGI